MSIKPKITIEQDDKIKTIYKEYLNADGSVTVDVRVFPLNDEGRAAVKAFIEAL